MKEFIQKTNQVGNSQFLLRVQKNFLFDNPLSPNLPITCSNVMDVRHFGPNAWVLLLAPLFHQRTIMDVEL